MYFASFLVLLLSIPALAQSGNPLFPSPARAPQYLRVTTSASAPSARTGGKVSLFVDVSPNPGMHVYAPGAKGYQAITVALDRSSSLTFGKTVYPKADGVFVESPSERVPVFQKPFRLVQDVTLGRALKAGTAVAVTGIVNYQACDDKVCYQPASVPVAWTLAVR